MAINHAKPNELVDLNDAPHDVDTGRSHTLIKTDRLHLARLILSAGQEVPSHTVSDTVIIQVISGAITLETESSRQSIGAGQLVYLMPNEPHALNAVEDSVVLLTILSDG